MSDRDTPLEREDMPQAFRTADGYTLHRTLDGWTDGDLAFQAGPDGLPVDDNGTPLEGSLLD